MDEISNADGRLADLGAFYAAIGRLIHAQGGPRELRSCDGRMGWPERGVYFFFEPGEDRTESGSGPRVVRVGTHAITAASRTTLWKRLSQHRGNAGDGGGNHRGSVFRKHVGRAVMARDASLEFPMWGNGNTASRQARLSEQPLERKVSEVIRAMPFVVLAIPDAPGADSRRAYVERNAIALLSNHGRVPLDPSSSGWLGRFCPSERVQRSGLWNSQHVEERYEPDFREQFDQLVGS